MHLLSCTSPFLGVPEALYEYLFGPHDPHNKGYRVYLFQRQLERFIRDIVRYKNDVAVVATSPHAFDDYALFAINNINPIPLKECIERQTFTGYYIAAVILRLHRITANTDKEFRSFEHGNVISITISLHDWRTITR